MTASWLEVPGEALRRLSGGALLFAIMAVAAVTALVLSWSLLSASAEAERGRLDAIRTQLSSVLEEGGLAGLTQRLADIENATLPGAEAVEIAIWRTVAGEHRLHRATSPAAAAAFAAIPPGTTSLVALDGRPFLAQAADIAALSGSWSMPMADVEMVYALPSPSAAGRAARLTVAAVWAGLCMALVVGLLLHAHHGRRYRDGLQAINARLERFSSGETAMRLSEDTPAPELRALSARLNQVLPRIDELVSGLRYLSAHMAHEMKTPLQSIRGDLARLIGMNREDDRANQARAIDRTIDLANARLHSLMQLFRLESMVAIPMAPLDLGRTVEYAVDDMSDALQSGNRRLTVSLEGGIEILGNRNLVELLVGNLLGNANKYAVPGSEIIVNLVRHGGRFRFSVANTGVSFTPDIRLSAFDRFSRGRSTDDVPGVGIGLSLVKAIAQRHGFTAEITPSDSIAEIAISGNCNGMDARKQAPRNRDDVRIVEAHASE